MHILRLTAYFSEMSTVDKANILFIGYEVGRNAEMQKFLGEKTI